MINQKLDKTVILRIFGQNIKDIREYRKISEETVANDLGITETEIKNIEEGSDSELRFELMIEICNYYNCTLQQALDLQIVQVFNNSQNITAGDRKVSLTNKHKDGYLEYINHLKEEISELKSKLDKR